MNRLYKFQRHDQKGYTVLLAVGVLMGLLAIVTSLVRFNKSNQNQMDHHLYEAKVSSIDEMALSMCRLRWKLAGGTEMSRLQRNWVLPGKMSIPYKLKVSTYSSQVLTVEDSIPLFMALASHYDDNGRPMFLDDDKSVTDPIEKEDLSDNDKLDTGDYLIVGNELILESGARGEAGVKRPHEQGERVYGIIDELWNRGLVRYRGKYYDVVDIDFMMNEITLSSGSNPSPMSSGEIVEYYPFDPGKLSNEDNTFSFFVEVSNEQSRININSLTEDNMNFLFPGLYAQLLGNLKYPLVDTKNLLRGTNNLSGYLLYRDILTTYSEPDNRQNDKYAPMFMGAQGDLSDRSVYKIDGALDRSSILPNNKMVQPHAVNINEASKWTLINLFQMMNFNSTDAQDLADDIMDYTIGNTQANPFDGTDQRTMTYHASPEEEFRYYLVELGLSSAEINQLMCHVDMESSKLSQLTDQENGPQISFEAGDIWRIKTHVVVGDKNEPKVTSSREMVVKHVAYTGSANIVLNNHNGWNDHYSAFYGLSSGALVNISDNGHLLPSRNDGIARGMKFRYNNTEDTIGDPQVKDLDNSGNVIFYESPSIASNIMMDFGLRVKAGVVQSFNSSDPFTSSNVIGGNALMKVDYSSFTSSSSNVIVVGSIVFDSQSTPFEAYVMSVDVASQMIDLETKNGSATGLSNFKIIRPYDADHYDPSSGQLNVRGGDGFVGPTYETVLVRDGAEFKDISWVDSTDFGGGPPVSVQYYDSDLGWQTLTNPDDISVYDKLRIRVLFDHSSLPNPTNFPPQLFEIKVTYKPYDDAPENIVYMRR